MRLISMLARLFSQKNLSVSRLLSGIIDLPNQVTPHALWLHLWSRVAFRHKVRFKASVQQYSQIYEWMVINIPDYQKQVFGDFAYIRKINSYSGTVEKSLEGHLRFKCKKHAMLFSLTWL